MISGFLDENRVDQHVPFVVTSRVQFVLYVIGIRVIVNAEQPLEKIVQRRAAIGHDERVVRAVSLREINGDGVESGRRVFVRRPIIRFCTGG